VLSLGNGVHLLRRYRLSIRANKKHAESVATALRETAFPNALSSLTTAGGFLSLLMANLVPVQEFGILAAAGMLVNLIVTLTVGPLMLQICRPPRSRRESQRSASPVHNRYTPVILVVTACIIVVSGIGALNVKAQTNPLSFFPDNSKIVEAYEFVSKNLAGIYSLEVVLTLPGPWTNPAQWPPIETVRKALEDDLIVTRAINPLDVLRLLNHWENDLAPNAYALPASQTVAQRYLANLEPAEREALQRYVSPSGHTIRLSALVNDMDTGLFLDLVHQLDETLGDLPNDTQGYSTGVVLDIVTAQQALIGAQRRSLLLASGIVLLCLLLGLRSLRLMLIAIIPNGLPLLVMFGTMGLLGLRLDPATAMVASVALGIAVDDTVHLLVAYARERRQGSDVATAIGVALGAVGKALKITTAVACLGFLIMLLSSFAPIRHFGFLATIGMIVALLADLYIVPALLVIGASHSKENTQWCPSRLHTKGGS